MRWPPCVLPQQTPRFNPALKRSAGVLSNENRTRASERFPAHVLLGDKSKETLLLDPDFVISREGFLLLHFSVLFLLNAMKMCNSVKQINKCLVCNVSRRRDGGWSPAAVPWEGATGVGLVTPGSPRLGLAGLPSVAQASVLPEIVQVPCRSPEPVSHVPSPSWEGPGASLLTSSGSVQARRPRVSH